MIEQTVIDGVTTLIAPSAGPTHGGIAFRVGKADEPLSRAGLTHLVEHLALHHLGSADYHYNGTTGITMTTFFSAGSPEDVAAYLAGVCDALANLPLDRLEMEKEILRTEASSRSRGVTEPMALWRYGARGYGLASYPEWGLPAIGADTVRDWSARYFTKENAVAYIAGEIPAKLEFRLPSGHRQPLPPVTSALHTTPAFFVGPAKAVALDAVVKRGPAAQVFTHVLERELFRTLRQEGGYSYTAATDYEPRDATHAFIVALADALPEKQGAVLGGLIDVLAKLRVGRIEPADVAAVVEKSRDGLAHPEVDAARLPMAAFNVLIGHPIDPVEKVLAEIAAVTPADIQAVAAEASASALLMVPEGHNAMWAGFEPAPTDSTAAVTGTRYPMRNQRQADLIVGPDGVSVVAEESLATVRFDECAAMLVWPDGGRLLVGNDSLVCRAEPTLYDIPEAALRQIDAAVPADRQVPQPAREADAIPRPPDPVSVSAPRAGKFSGLRIAGISVLGLISLILVCFSGLATLGLAGSEEEIEGGWVVVGGFWLVTLVVVVWLIRLIRRSRASV